MLFLLVIVLLVSVHGRPFEDVCLFVGYVSGARGSYDGLVSFKPGASDLKVLLKESPSRSFHLSILNSSKNPYNLIYRSQPLTGTLLRSNKQVQRLDSISRGEFTARDNDLIVIRIPNKNDATEEWPSLESELTQYYESVEMLQLSQWEQRQLKSLIRKSAAVLVARVSCISTVQLEDSDEIPDDQSSIFSNSSRSQQPVDSSSNEYDNTSSTD